MDYDVEDVDDIDVIVKDTNAQMEFEHKLVSDLMKSLEYEQQQEKYEELLQDGKKEAKNVRDSEQEIPDFCESSESGDEDLGGLEHCEIPVIVIETEEEWKRREYDEKTPGKRDTFASPGEITNQGKQDSKEDFEFEINMERFQKKLSDVVKDDMSTQAKSKDIFPSILEELESHIEKEAFVSCKEDKADEKDYEFETVLRAGEEGQSSSATSELEISCETNQRYLLDMPHNMSVDAQEFGLDPDPVPIIMDNSISDSPVFVESTRRSGFAHDYEGHSRQGAPETLSNSAPRCLENLTNKEGATSKDLVNHTTLLSNKPICFEETNNTTLDPRGQNDDISVISRDNFEIKNSDEVMPCESLEGGSTDELPHPLDCDIERTNIFQESVMDNVDMNTDSLSGIVSRNDVDISLSVELGDDLCEGRLEDLESFNLPVINGNGGNDGTENDLLVDQKLLAAGEDDDESTETMSREGEIYENSICTARKKTAENATVKAAEKTKWDDRMEMKKEIVWDNRMEMEGNSEGDKDFFKLEERNLISFDDDDDDDVYVTYQGLPLATASIVTTVAEKEESGQMGHFDLLTELNRVENSRDIFNAQSNKINTNFSSEENESGNEMENGKRQNEREMKNVKDVGKDFPPVPVIGTLVEISPQCRDDQLSREPAGIPLGLFENTDVIINSCKDQIFCEIPTCTDMYSTEQQKTNIIGKMDDEKQTEIREEKRVKGNEEKDRNKDGLSREEGAENSCGYDGLKADAGNVSTAHVSHEIQTMDKNNCCLKDEEVLGKKIEDTFCGSTKRQREQDVDVEVGLKKLKIIDSSEEEHSTYKHENTGETRESRNSSLGYEKEENIQEIESLGCEKTAGLMERECCFNIEENIAAPEICITEHFLFTSQELDSQVEQEKGNILVILEENCELEYGDGTSKCTLGIVATAEDETEPIVKYKSMGIESFEEMCLNIDLIARDSKNLENVEIQNSLPCCYGYTTSGNEVNENNTNEFDPGKLVLEDEETEGGGNHGKDEQQMINFQEEIKQFELQLSEDCSVVKGALETSAVDEDSVLVLSDHLNELLIDEEEKQTDNENISSEEPLVEIPADSGCHDEVTQDEVTRLTYCSGREEQIHLECLATGEEVEGYVTQEEPYLKRDSTLKLKQYTGQEEQIHPESQTTEPKKEDVTQGEECVTQDVDKNVTKLTQGTAENEQTHPVSLETKRERYEELEGCVTPGEERTITQEVKIVKPEVGEEPLQRVSKDNEWDKDLDMTQETEKRVTQRVKKKVTQDAPRVKTSSQIVEQSVTQDTLYTASHNNIALEMEKRIAEGVSRDEKDGGVVTLGEQQKGKTERQVTQLEEVAQEVDQDVALKLEHEKNEIQNLEKNENHADEVALQLAEEVTQVCDDDAKGLELVKGGTQEKKRVTQLKDNKVKDEVQGATIDVNRIKQLGREVTQSEMEGDVTQEAEENAKEEVDGVITQLQIENDREEGRQKTVEELAEISQEQGCELLDGKNEIVNQFSTDKQEETKVKDFEKKAQDSGINFNHSQENRIESAEEKTKSTSKEEVDDKSRETGRKVENLNESEMVYLQELEKDEEKENRIRSFEMLFHLETIIKELEMYRSEQKRLRDSFKTCMSEIMNNLSSMTKAVQLMETQLNHKIKDAHEKLKKCCENLEGNRATILSMDTLLRSYSATQSQFGDLRQKVKDLEIICMALNISETQDKISNQVSAEIDAMDRRVKFTENDISDLKLRVTELEVECSSLRKLSPVEEQVENQAGNRELKFGRTNSRTENSSGRTRGNLNEELSLSRSSPVIGPGQRYYGLYSEEV